MKKKSIFSEVQTKAFKYALAYELTIWVCDMRGMAYLEVADQNWLIRDIFTAFDPRFQQLFAYIINSTGLELMSSLRIEDLVQHDPQLHQRLQVGIFLNKESAQQWLTLPKV
ncbi:hypothetical protein FVR03_16380 [Pontibacter qinzhouensis]|uniref:STAS/SEC14 domain-containing protein n=1 Tax=Pontibacter qinzhouensis TaxID=2603253 RepID=A0A5C8JJV0_9BACT|nr:hypothetical protein [Pontibacter qinzhouensis]TXK36954.1 hypothetical protein FVR03_16380 [Pontibacter qinzhouensis]